MSVTLPYGRLYEKKAILTMWSHVTSVLHVQDADYSNRDYVWTYCREKDGIWRRGPNDAFSWWRIDHAAIEKFNELRQAVIDTHCRLIIEGAELE